MEDGVMLVDSDDISLRRRDVVCGGGAAVFSAIVAALLGGAKPARAQPISGSVPEVDRVAVRVVIDSYQIAVAPSTKTGNVEIQRFGWGIGGGKPPRKTLVSEFGLSMHAESQRGNDRRQILVDFGFTPEALNNNVELLGIDPAAIDALVLSHGHYDHFGGLVGFLKQNNGKLKAKLPFYVGGEDCFCSREWTAPPVRGDFGALDRKALKDANVTVTYAEGPALIADHGFASGQIRLTSFERLLSPSAMKIGVEQDFGCYPERLPEEDRAKGVVPDQFRHEIATTFNLKGRGLVVLTVVQPSRRRECGQAGPGGFGGEKGSRRDGRIPSRAVQGGLRAGNDRVPQGDRSRLRHSHALYGRAILGDRQSRDADQAAACLYRNTLRL
jgi:7,8-dihydropterin-6-yl-methyl-4-(beta-D-ribofuranosyl)aminobenzene 5'-phosphate synthase